MGAGVRRGDAGSGVVPAGADGAPEGAMADQEKKTIRIDLTEEQQKKVEEATGKPAQSVELDIQELEERVNPTVMME